MSSEPKSLLIVCVVVIASTIVSSFVDSFLNAPAESQTLKLLVADKEDAKADRKEIKTSLRSLELKMVSDRWTRAQQDEYAKERQIWERYMEARISEIEMRIANGRDDSR